MTFTEAAWLRTALNGSGAFPVSDYFQPAMAEAATGRMRRIMANLNYYLGNHRQFDNVSDGERQVVYNYVRSVVNKSVRWMCNPPWAIRSHDPAGLVAEFFESVWTKSRKKILFRNLVQMGAISGDAFCYVGVRKAEIAVGEPGERYLYLRSLNSLQTHPVFDAEDPTRLVYVVTQQPIRLSSGTVNGVRINDPGNTYPMAVETKVYTDTEVFFFINGTAVGSELAHGFIPIVHIPNMLMTSSPFGQDEISHIAGLNMSINEVSSNLKEIVEYYASPLTVIYGHHLGNIRRDTNSVWSGLDVNSRVETLDSHANLGDSLKVKEALIRSLHETSNIPMGSLTSEQVVSNVSEAALRVYFMPLLEMQDEKHETYSDGVNRINQIVARVCEEFFNISPFETFGDGVNPTLADETYVDFTSPIPRDSAELLQTLEAKLRNNLISRVQALRETGVTHVEQEAMNILSDMVEELFISYQRGQAALGIPVSFSGVGVGSLGQISGMREELGKVAEIADKLDASDDAIAAQVRAAMSADGISEVDETAERIIEAAKAQLNKRVLTDSTSRRIGDQVRNELVRQ